MASLSNWLDDFHESSKKWDPLTHYALDAIHKSSTKAVNTTSDGLATTADKWGWNSKFPRYWEERSAKDEGDFGRWGENTIGSAAAIYGAGEAYGAGAGGGSGGGSGGWLSGVSSGDGSMLVNASDAGGGAAGGGGSSWMKALSGGLKGSGNSMSQNAEKSQSSQDRRTAELLAQILREQKDEEPPGFINPNAVPANQNAYA